MSRDERDEVPAEMSSCSMRAARIPRDAASNSAPAPTMPPPMMTTSQVSASRRARSYVRTANGSVAAPNGRVTERSRVRSRPGDAPQQPGGTADEDGDEHRSLEDRRLHLVRQEARQE